MIYSQLFQNPRKCSFALLIDPDKCSTDKAQSLSKEAQELGVDAILLGGSLVSSDISPLADIIKANTSLPLILFPGGAYQFVPNVDAILLLALISGRNPEFLIGNHVQIAMRLKESRVEVIPTGYMLIEGGASTSVQYVSNTQPIPANKPDIAVATAVAGEQLGLRAIYLEAGSGATTPVSLHTIGRVRAQVSQPLIVGGGLKTAQQVRQAKNAGANMVVVGTAAESNFSSIHALANATK